MEDPRLLASSPLGKRQPCGPKAHSTGPLPIPTRATYTHQKGLLKGGLLPTILPRCLLGDNLAAPEGKERGPEKREHEAPAPRS
jgi:hypothetical protein